LQLETHLLTSKGVRSLPPATQHLDIFRRSSNPSHIVDDQTFDRARYGRGWRCRRRKETVNLHLSPVTPRRSVLGHGRATDYAAPPLPTGSDNNSLNCQSLWCFCKL